MIDPVRQASEWLRTHPEDPYRPMLRDLLYHIKVVEDERERVIAAVNQFLHGDMCDNEDCRERGSCAECVNALEDGVYLAENPESVPVAS